MNKTTPRLHSLSPRSFCTGALIASAAFATISLQAEDVSDWQIRLGSTFSGLDTNSPVMGDGTTNSADSHFIYAALGTSYTLPNVGDSVTFSGAMTLTGWSNFNPSTGSNQFRFGLYDSSGNAGTTGWQGFWASNSQSNITNEGPGRLYERNNPNTGEFYSSVGATELASQNVDNVPFDSGDYVFDLTVERVSGTELSVAWTIANTAGGAYSLSHSWTGVPDNNSLSFDRVSLGAGGSSDVDQVSFSNLQVTSIPEPSTLALASVVIGAALFLRRRSA